MEEDIRFNKLKESTIKIIGFLKDELDQLKRSYDNNENFDEILSIIYGRFSKLELNLVQLEKFKNANTQRS